MSVSCPQLMQVSTVRIVWGRLHAASATVVWSLLVIFCLREALDGLDGLDGEN